MADTPTGIDDRPAIETSTENTKKIINSPKLNLTVNCGVRNAQGIDFNFLGGTNEANFGEFPWMVAILRRNSNQREPFMLCGGSIIGARVILTGAHCVDK